MARPKPAHLAGSWSPLFTREDTVLLVTCCLVFATCCAVHPWIKRNLPLNRED